MFIHISGTKYVGTWKEGKREGHGELIHANHKYVGVYKDDKVQLYLSIASMVIFLLLCE